MSSVSLVILCILLPIYFLYMGVVLGVVFKVSAWVWMMYGLLVVITFWSLTPAGREHLKKSQLRQREQNQKWLKNLDSTMTQKPSSDWRWDLLAKAIGESLQKNTSSSKTYVKPYRRQDDTYVRGHYRRKRK